MPPDNAATVAPGTDVGFPQDGPNSGATITRIGPDSFDLAQQRLLSRLLPEEHARFPHILSLHASDKTITVVREISPVPFLKRR